MIPRGPAVRTGREVTIDWFEATVKGVEVAGLLDLMTEHLGQHFCVGLEILRDDARRFDARGSLGLRVRADRVGQVDRKGNRQPWSGVRLPGEVCRAAGTGRVLDLAEAMGTRGKLKVSRLDLALDDFDKTFSAEQFATTCVEGSLADPKALLGRRVVTRVRRKSWDWRRSKGGCFWIGGGQGARLLRVYDKDQESGGKIASTRIELQNRDEFATALCERLLVARREGRQFGEVFAEHVVEFVDLREPKGHRSDSQMWPRVEFWRKIVGDAKGITTPAGDDSSVWHWLGAIRRQFGGAFGVLLRAAGVTPGGIVRGRHDLAEARKILSAVSLLVGTDLGEMSAEHELRLGQLTRERGRNVRRMMGRRRLDP